MGLCEGLGKRWVGGWGGTLAGQSPAAILPERLLTSTEAAPLLVISRNTSVAFTAATCILGNASSSDTTSVAAEHTVVSFSTLSHVVNNVSEHPFAAIHHSTEYGVA